MSASFWQTEVYGVAPLANLDRTDTDEVFRWLEGALPTRDSKIDWSSVRGAHSHRHFEDDVELAREAVGVILRLTVDLPGVEHVGDSLSPWGVRFTGVDVPAIVTALLEVPEHHYFLGSGRTWLVVVSFEGDLDVVEHLGAGDGPSSG